MQLLVMKQDIGTHKKGDIVEIRASSTPFGGKEPDAFALIEVPGVPMKAYKHLSQAWEREIGFNLVLLDVVTDKYTLEAIATNGDASVPASVITLDEIQKHIEEWKGKVIASGTNSITFTLSVFDALTSPSFWELPANETSLLEYIELSYDQLTGVHQIQLDYSALPNNPTYIENYIDMQGLEVVSNNDKVLVYNADRSVVKNAVQKKLKNGLETTIARRRYGIPASVVDDIIKAGGTKTISDIDTAISYVKDKMNLKTLVVK